MTSSSNAGLHLLPHSVSFYTVLDSSLLTFRRLRFPLAASLQDGKSASGYITKFNPIYRGLFAG